MFQNGPNLVFVQTRFGKWLAEHLHCIRRSWLWDTARKASDNTTPSWSLFGSISTEGSFKMFEKLTNPAKLVSSWMQPSVFIVQVAVVWWRKLFMATTQMTRFLESSWRPSLPQNFMPHKENLNPQSDFSLFNTKIWERWFNSYLEAHHLKIYMRRLPFCS